MSSVMDVRDLRVLLDLLISQYEYPSENRGKVERKCSRLREYIDAQV
jgi:hypothetical protein